MWWPGASWGTTWGAHFVKTKFLTESARFAGCPKSEAQKETLWWSGPSIWSTVAAAGSGGEERWAKNLEKLLCGIELQWVSSGRKQKQLWNKRGMRWDLCPSRRQTGIYKHPTSSVNTKSCLSHYFWQGLQLTHGAGSLRRFLLPLWLQSRTRDLWTIQIRRLPRWVAPHEVANALLSCSTGNNNKFKTIEECDEMCVENDFKLMLTDKCEQPIEPGPWWDRYQPIFVFFIALRYISANLSFFNALRYISANLCLFQCS